MMDFSNAFINNKSLLSLSLNVNSDKTDISNIVDEWTIGNVEINLKYKENINTSRLNGSIGKDNIKIYTIQEMKDEYKSLEKYNITFKTKGE